MTNIRKLDLSLYFIADPSVCTFHPIHTVVAAAIEGGATLIQYRDKSKNMDQIKDTACTLLTLCQSYNIPLLINDHVEIAAEIGADGVHIGQGDMSPAEAKASLHPDSIIGLTAFTPEHFAAIDPAIVDYTGTGPVYPTKTDKGKPVIGPDGLAKLIPLSPVPVVGIGGITKDNAAAVMRTGAAGIAMMRAISGAERPDLAAAELLKIINTSRHCEEGH